MIAVLDTFDGGAMTWRPHLPAVLSGLVIALLAVWVRHVYRRMRTRMSARRAAVLMAPKLLAAGLLIVALFDPLWTRTTSLAVEGQILAVLDTSSSMDTQDAGGKSRFDRAGGAVEQLRNALPASVGMTTLHVDTALREADKPAPGPAGSLRGTDLGAGMLALSERADLSSHAAVVLLTDGGDEPVDAVRLPDVPVHIVGVGSDLAGVTDLAVTDVLYPASVEKETEFDVAVDVAARPGALSAEAFARTRIVLERREGDAWRQVTEKAVNLANRRARVHFKAACPSVGLHAFRVALDPAAAEVTTLNNVRTLKVEARKKALHVLYFARDVGVGLKMLRAELAPDPGITFTVLFRTTGERFTVQGEQLPGAEDLEAGFPSDVNLLALFDCVILGAFPDAEWRAEQLEALRGYSEQGGAVVFFGGETAYSTANTAAVALAPMLPWQLTGRRDVFLRGLFPVSLPPAAAGHPIVAGMAESVAAGGQAVVESANETGQLKPGATRLMTMVVDHRAGPLVALQRYGEGTVLAIASNTFWKWARQSPELRQAYGLFWRQAVRNLTGSVEGGRLLLLKWDKAFYRPGERAVLQIRTAGDEARSLQLSASVAIGGQTRAVPVVPVQGQRGEYEAKILFERRGEYSVVLTAHESGQMVESYEKTLPVGPVLGEGARIEIDHKALAALAHRTGGLYVKESDVGGLAEHLAARHLRKTVRSDRSILSGSPAFATVFLCILVLEWILRRASNLY